MNTSYFYQIPSNRSVEKDSISHYLYKYTIMEFEASPLILTIALVTKILQKSTYLPLFFAILSSCLLVYWLFICPGTVAVISNVHSGNRERQMRLYQEWLNAQQQYEFEVRRLGRVGVTVYM